MALVPTPWITNANPSAVGEVPGVTWKLKLLVKEVTLWVAPYQALLASYVPPSVRRRRVPFRTVLPFNTMPPPELKPLPKLMLPLPPEEMVYTAVETALAV